MFDERRVFPPRADLEGGRDARSPGPFYTGTVVFGAKRNVHELGTYLKVHINTEGHPGGGGGFFNDIDDD